MATKALKAAFISIGIGAVIFGLSWLVEESLNYFEKSGKVKDANEIISLSLDKLTDKVKANTEAQNENLIATLENAKLDKKARLDSLNRVLDINNKLPSHLRGPAAVNTKEIESLTQFVNDAEERIALIKKENNLKVDGAKESTIAQFDFNNELKTTHSIFKELESTQKRIFNLQASIRNIGKTNEQAERDDKVNEAIKTQIGQLQTVLNLTQSLHSATEKYANSMKGFQDGFNQALNASRTTALELGKELGGVVPCRPATRGNKNPPLQ